MINIAEINFEYQTLCDYNYYKDCSNYGCEEEGICRCGTIENARVISVNIPSMVTEIHTTYFDDSLSSKRNSTINNILGDISKEIDIYTIDRILRINKVYEIENWEVKVHDGYYGQEMGNVILENSVALKIENQLDRAFDIIDLTERIEYLLELEYGRVLPVLKGCKYSIEMIERDSIIFGSDMHYRKVNTKNLEHYSDNNYTGIKGIALVKDDRFRLIDGYHRSSTSENIKIKLLIAR